MQQPHRRCISLLFTTLPIVTFWSFLRAVLHCYYWYVCPGRDVGVRTTFAGNRGHCLFVVPRIKSFFLRPPPCKTHSERSQKQTKRRREGFIIIVPSVFFFGWVDVVVFRRSLTIVNSLSITLQPVRFTATPSSRKVPSWI